MSNIELVRHGDNWRYIDDEGRISSTYEVRPMMHAAEDGGGPDWLTGLHAHVEWLRFQRDERLALLERTLPWDERVRIEENAATYSLALEHAEAEYSRELARCSACGGTGYWLEPGTDCPRCDGCGWYEGGPAIQTHCEDCNGTGIGLPEEKKACPHCNGTGEAAAERETVK